VQPFKAFHRAEEYHLDYYAKHPAQAYCANVIAPEIREFREKFKDKLKPSA
jgi:peptide methionine sulfoxide reductase MsrA